ncbi:TIGR02452 family protein [Chitinophaga rhizophila]|uniref:TIGR02452 family protein n=1 Tax=Chitinophaga rhizophila TaxID=2866212 RepID=A0ABS7G933_9BACT|nr:TIGR02452 family protein [Chitinophaga rhizophila]MBW8684176.1 TIGR02452 family protein [Chitinophaga rhizophila]
MNRNERVRIAYETQDILATGNYTNRSNEVVDLSADLQYTIGQTVHYTPEDFDQVIIRRDALLQTRGTDMCRFEVTAETTFGAAARLIIKEQEENVCCLNFASAKNPGGGFLTGAQAQEESLARASGLYASLQAKPEMYQINRENRSLLYTDHMIYSPLVPVFRNDRDHLLDVPYRVSIITAPAVNRGALLNNEPASEPRIEPVMMERIEKLLSVAVVNNQTTLVLGAWGCGVFRNKTEDVARWFAHHLYSETFKYAFKRIVFAIYDPSPKRTSIDAFRKEFGAVGYTG